MGAAPDDADEEGAQGRDAGGYDGYGGFRGGPDGDWDVIPCVYLMVIAGSRLDGSWGSDRDGRTCEVLLIVVLAEDNEAGDADGADAGCVVSLWDCLTGMERRGDGEAYVRPKVKMRVRINFCGWLVLKRQRIGIG